MQRLSRALLSQLTRSSPQAALHSSTAAAPTAAAAAAGASLFSIRWFSSSEGSQRLYIGNLSFDATQEDLMAAFEKYGPVHDMTLPRRPDGKHKGFGFVELDAAAAESAIKDLDQSEVAGRPIHVKVAEPSTRRPRREPRAAVVVRPGFTRLYVGNLNFRTTAADLGKHFQQFGAVQDCVIPLDAAGRSRGYGFVELDDQGAAAALKALDGATFDGRELTVRNQERPSYATRPSY